MLGLLDSRRSFQHVRDEAVGELVFFVEDPNHFVFFDDKHGRGVIIITIIPANQAGPQGTLPLKNRLVQGSQQPASLPASLTTVSFTLPS